MAALLTHVHIHFLTFVTCLSGRTSWHCTSGCVLESLDLEQIAWCDWVGKMCNSRPHLSHEVKSVSPVALVHESKNSRDLSQPFGPKVAAEAVFSENPRTAGRRVKCFRSLCQSFGNVRSWFETILVWIFHTQNLLVNFSLWTLIFRFSILRFLWMTCPLQSKTEIVGQPFAVKQLIRVFSIPSIQFWLFLVVAQFFGSQEDSILLQMATSLFVLSMLTATALARLGGPDVNTTGSSNASQYGNGTRHNDAGRVNASVWSFPSHGCWEGRLLSSTI